VTLCLTTFARLIFCVSALGVSLQLNPTKTELIRFGSQVNLEHLTTTDVSVRVGQTVIQPSDYVRDLGVILDSIVHASTHQGDVDLFLLSVVSSQDWQGTNQETHNRLVCAAILTRIDYCNSLFAGLPDSTLVPPLQCVFHATARFIGGLQPLDHVGCDFISVVHINCFA